MYTRIAFYFIFEINFFLTVACKHADIFYQ